MKKILYLITLSFFIACSNSQKPLDIIALQPYNIWSNTPDSTSTDSIFISMDGADLLLPTYVKSDYGIISDTIFEVTGYDSISDRYLFSDKISRLPGDTIANPYLTYYNVDFAVRVSFAEDGIYLSSPNMLRNCLMNLYYSEKCLLTTYGVSDRTNQSLDFLRQEGSNYIYFSPYSKWKTGPYKYFSALAFVYNPSIDLFSVFTSDYYHGREIRPSTVFIGRPDVEKYCKSLLPRLVQN